MDGRGAEEVSNGDLCAVVAGTDEGKAGTVEDRHDSKTGHVTITCREASGSRFYTLARDVVVGPA